MVRLPSAFKTVTTRTIVAVAKPPDVLHRDADVELLNIRLIEFGGILGLTIAGFKRAYDQPWLRCLTTAGAVLGIQAALLILLTLLSANIPILKAGWA